MSNGFPPGPWNGGGEWEDDGTLALTDAPAPGPLGIGDAGTPIDYVGAQAGSADSPFDWKAYGFSAPPRLVVSDGRPLFRVWGGTSLERGNENGRGVFFSFARPSSRFEAERLFAVAEFGNACTFVSQFDVPPGIPMFVGNVDPGDDVHPALAAAGEQVFIQNPWAQRLVRVGPANRLENDLGGAWIYSGPKTREPEKGAKGGWN
jgi:hypothetical protein